MQCNMFGEWDPDAEGQLLQRQARSVRCQRNFAVIFAIFGEGYISLLLFEPTVSAGFADKNLSYNRC